MSKTKMLTLTILVVILLTGAPAIAGSINLNGVSPQSPILEEADWIFETDQGFDTRAGWNPHLAVSSGCDVNGDKYDDIVVTRKDYDLGIDYADAGRGWLFMGGSDGLSTNPVVIFDPPQLLWAGSFGMSVACAGDVNGDNMEDIIIGMPNYESTPSLSAEGAVFVYYGTTEGPKATYNWMARGGAALKHLGQAVDSAGDVNGDGYDDIIVGTAENWHNPVSYAYVWYGGPNGLGDNDVPSNADWVATGPTPGAIEGHHFGYFVYGVGSVNGDNFDDVMVTAWQYDGVVTDEGAAFVWYGGPGGLGEPGTPENADWKATSGQVNSYFGASGDGIGDVNGDGFGDLAVGAVLYDTPLQDAGKVFVWYGGPDGLGDSGTPGNANWSAEGTVGINFGFTVHPAGDVNHDGISDLLITAPYVEPPWHAGAWFVWLGSRDGLGPNGNLANADLAGYGTQEGAELGIIESGAGDVNQDGLEDIFVAAWHYTNGEFKEGAVFGYYSSLRLFLPLLRRAD